MDFYKNKKKTTLAKAQSLRDLLAPEKAEEEIGNTNF